MKTFITMLAVVFALFVTIPDAEARKFGGKRSIGKTQTTASQQQKTTADSKTAAAQKKSSKKGLMGGLLGGLLAGGLIAAMMGGAFEGFQFMDLLIFAAIAFILFKIFRSISQAKAGAQQRQQPAYAANQQQFKQQLEPTAQQQSSGLGGGFANSSDHVPFNLPAGFDLSSFLEGARSHYKTLQQAWNDNDLTKIQEYVSNELYNELSQQRGELDSEPNTEVMYLDAELVRADNNAQLAEISVKFSGRYRDIGENIEEDIAEIWHLERQLTHPDAPWLIVGIEQ
jgi:predicted lipid-binding transport protein (Tim44 family)